MSAARLKSLLALAGLLLAVTLGAAGCRAALNAPPAIFRPSACPAGWHRLPDGSCLTTGTLRPGQGLPLPSPDGTRLPRPLLPSPSGGSQ